MILLNKYEKIYKVFKKCLPPAERFWIKGRNFGDIYYLLDTMIWNDQNIKALLWGGGSSTTSKFEGATTLWHILLKGIKN